MEVTAAFFFGFVAATVGTSIPGLLNLTAVKISVQEGSLAARWFALGAALILGIQAWIALVFARYLEQHSEITNGLIDLSILLFLAMSAYFFATSTKAFGIRKKRKKYQSVGNSSRFLQGTLMSSMNLFPIPYYVFISLTLVGFSFFPMQLFYVQFFVFGAFLAAFIVFLLYVRLFKNTPMQENSMRYMNRVIGAVTLAVAVLNIWKRIND